MTHRIFRNKFCKTGILLSQIIFSLSWTTAFSQDYTWWNELHNWDGVTHWSEYIITNPAYMGPNALPVPEISNGALYPEAYFEGAIDLHFSRGDNTQNLYGKLYVPLMNCKVAFQSDVVALEHFQMTEETRDERFARTYSGEGWIGGDIYLGALIQIVKDRGKWPDILFSANFKTASGGKLFDARYTDSPGYSFDLSLGKDLGKNKNSNLVLRPYIVLGFYSWQTHRDDYMQNDALLYGGGIDLNLKAIHIANQVGGYSGYIGNGDKPLVYRLKLLIRRKKFDYRFTFQQGLHDFEYSSFRVSAAFKFLN